ncbi:hypothetical protein [Actinomadura harenae]|uniref:DUF4760 domain-containing protein n=1 Tax=Actinomadura harenae TaxID=2483351 RepID=A0A3M2ME01_9ACTN|nr:hypothetical protein [Actinomadura harenae]RMI47220.1 hypothetical protein EBO15_03270 [Actinomadura harenae]
MSLAISFIALAFSLAVFLHGRWRDNRDLFLKLHERLVDAEMQKGRRLLYEVAAQRRDIADLSEGDHLVIHHALAAFNVLGIYYQRRYVSRRDVLDLWALPLVRTLAAAQPFLEERDAHQGVPVLSQFRSLCGDASDYLHQQGISYRPPHERPEE